MKKLSLVVAATLLMAGIAAADTICAGGVALTTAATFTCGSLTLSNFSVVNGDGGTLPTLFIVNGSVTSNGEVFVNFNPQLSPANGTTADLQLSFAVSGGVRGVDLLVGGLGATVNEVVCTTATTSAGTCSDGGTLLANMVGVSQGGEQTSFFALTNPIYVFKDIGVTSNGALTGFQQSFVTPEPASMILFGSGAVLLAGFRRRALGKR